MAFSTPIVPFSWVEFCLQAEDIMDYDPLMLRLSPESFKLLLIDYTVCFVDKSLFNGVLMSLARLQQIIKNCGGEIATHYSKAHNGRKWVRIGVD